MTVRLVLGVDAGGTSTRALLASATGETLGTGRAGGANQRSSTGSVADSLVTAISGALGDRDPASVGAAVVGVAGAAAAGRPWAQAALAEASERVGLPAPPRLATDIAIAYAGGSPARRGSVLLAGTGAVAAAVSDGEVTHRSDGYGWLLGDTGSAVWLGLQAVRRSLEGLDGRGPATALLDAVVIALVPPGSGVDVAQALIAATDQLRPAELGRLAPAVGEAADRGDAVARALVDEAAGALLASLDAVRRAAGEQGVPVVGGSVLTGAGPVADAVRRGIVERYGAAPAVVRDAAAGATVMALRSLTGAPVTPDVHRRLTGGLP